MIKRISGPRLAMRPAWRGFNPYTGLLADALKADRYEVRELYRTAASVLKPADALILHWPDEMFVADRFSARVRGIRSLISLMIARNVQRKKIFWVGHNLVPHKRANVPSKFRLSMFLRSVDGMIFLSTTSRQLFESAYPALVKVPSVVIPHGHYRPAESTVPTLPPSLGHRPSRLAFIGQIKRYKGPDVLARTVASLPRDLVELHIAGRCSEPSLESEICEISETSPNVMVEFGFLETARIEQVIDHADAVVLPYRNILNSGSALLALSRFRPVIAPRLGSLVELQAEVGNDWLWLYDGDLTAATLRSALQWVTQPRRVPPDLSRQDWTLIGTRLGHFIREVLQADSRTSRAP